MKFTQPARPVWRVTGAANMYILLSLVFSFLCCLLFVKLFCKFLMSCLLFSSSIYLHLSLHSLFLSYIYFLIYFISVLCIYSCLFNLHFLLLMRSIISGAIQFFFVNLTSLSSVSNATLINAS